MLYKLTLNDNGPKNGLEPLPFSDCSQLGIDEKGLENLLANNLLDKLFEDNALMPIHQERPYQCEADIYAVNEKGDLVIFELKCGVVGADAVTQILGYAQTAGQWGYDKLNSYFKEQNPEKELIDAHKEAFQLDRALTPAEFNRTQHLYVVGSAADRELVKSLTYWKSKGLSLEFIPYRIYKLGNDKDLYFEFFAKPYDIHTNPGQQKGVILDTNQTYNKECVWDMLKKNRASAYGEQAYFAYYLKRDDIVFLSHKGYGIIAAGKVETEAKEERNEDLKEDREAFVNVKWLTKVPTKEQGITNYLSFSKVIELLGHGFFWARTLKTPYLSKEESELLLGELKKVTETNG